MRMRFGSFGLGGAAFGLGLLLTLILSVYPAVRQLFSQYPLPELTAGLSTGAMVTVTITAILVGLLNITVKETNTAILAAVGMSILGYSALATSLNMMPIFGLFLGGILQGVGLYAALVATVFLLKTFFNLVKSR